MQETLSPKAVVRRRFAWPVTSAVTSCALVAYVYAWYPLQPFGGLPVTHLTARWFVNGAGFLLALASAIVLSIGAVRASLREVPDRDCEWLFATAALLFLSQRSEALMTLGGYALRAAGAIATRFVGLIGNLPA